VTERRRVFSRSELVGIRAELRLGRSPACPRCSTPLLSRPIPPREDVAYVRHRIWLLCPQCQRSALLEALEGSAPGTPLPPMDRMTPSSSSRAPQDSNPSRGAPLPLVGWREWVGLPSLGILRIKAKVDTGARSSSLHATDLEEFEEGGKPWIRFTVLPVQKSDHGMVRVQAPVADRRAVRPSTGRSEVRPVVEVEVQVGDLRFPCEVTLARRDQMGFRMLLGRTALRRRFLVDPGRSYLQPPSSPGGPPDIAPPTEVSE
jgi:hypothetical protein